MLFPEHEQLLIKFLSMYVSKFISLVLLNWSCLLCQVVAVTDYAEGELFQILEDDGALPEEQVKRNLLQKFGA